MECRLCNLLRELEGWNSLKNIPGENMLLDFTELKKALKAVCEKLDHTNLNDIAFFEQNPSAERIATYIFNQIIEILKEEKIDLSYSPEKKEPWLWAVDVFDLFKDIDHRLQVVAVCHVAIVQPHELKDVVG